MDLLHVPLLIVAIVVSGAVAGAQAPPRDQTQPSARSGTAVIRGRVFAADTGKPLRRARISLSAPELGSDGRNASTDEDGRYEFTGLPAGRYTLRASRSGYLALRYGQRRPLEQGKPLELIDRATADHVDFTLPRMALITGRVTDEYGEPIEGVSVYALRMMFFNGKRQLVPTGSASFRTDDAGQYRLLGLPPGTYVVSAVTRETWTTTRNGVSQVIGYAPTYFPATTRAADARRVTVGLGKEAANTDISLVPGRAARVAGTAVDSQGRPFPNVAVRQEVRSVEFASFMQIAQASVAADGTFAIEHVPPGDYVLAASTGRGTDRPEIGELPITIDGVDIDDVRLTGSQGGSLVGTVVADGAAVPPFSRIRVSAVQFMTGQASPTVLGAIRNPGTGEVAPDGTFTMHGVFGRSRFQVSLPDGWGLKSIEYDGRDVTDAPIELRSGETWSDVRVTVTDRLTIVDGALVDAKQQPATEGTIILFAVDADKWTDNSRYVRSTRADQQGGWKVKGLPAGEYFAAAVDYVEDGMWNDPEYLGSLQSSAVRFSLADAGSQTLTLKVMSTER